MLFFLAVPQISSLKGTYCQSSFYAAFALYCTVNAGSIGSIHSRAFPSSRYRYTRCRMELKRGWGWTHSTCITRSYATGAESTPQWCRRPLEVHNTVTKDRELVLLARVKELYRSLDTLIYTTWSGLKIPVVHCQQHS